MTPDLHLLLHALIVLLVGLLSGAPMGRAITRDLGEDKIRAWRVAHSGLSMGGIMLMAMALVIGALNLTGWPRLSVVAPAIASGYGFAIGLPFGAITGQRGLAENGNTKNRIVYIGNMIGAYGSLISVVSLIVIVIRTMSVSDL